jgi:hypothetical protein
MRNYPLRAAAIRSAPRGRARKPGAMAPVPPTPIHHSWGWPVPATLPTLTLGAIVRSRRIWPERLEGAADGRRRKMRGISDSLAGRQPHESRPAASAVSYAAYRGITHGTRDDHDASGRPATSPWPRMPPQHRQQQIATRCCRTRAVKARLSNSGTRCGSRSRAMTSVTWDSRYSLAR